MNKNNSQKHAVCLVGTLIPDDWFYELQKHSRTKAASSPVIMQKLIYSSLSKHCKDITVYSYPPIASYPKGYLIGTARKKMYLDNGNEVNIVPIINVLGLKQLSVFISMFISLCSWCARNKNQKLDILTYADFLEYCVPALIVSRIFGAHVSVFLTEIPGYAHYHRGRLSLKDRLIIWSEKTKRKLHGKFDGYVFVSEHLKELVDIGNSPWTVVEGFADDNLWLETCHETSKEKIKTVMYAGSLGEAYNIKMLIDAFYSLKDDYRLWIYGNGKYADYVRKIASLDARITFFGSVSRKEVLEAEKKAHLLVHVKNPDDPHSRYAFSSKIIEYMASGTPILTTCVDGISEEYYKYAYLIKEVSVKGIQNALVCTLGYSNTDLEMMGNRAKEFVLREKCETVQAGKILNMMERIT